VAPMIKALIVSFIVCAAVAVPMAQAQRRPTTPGGPPKQGGAPGGPEGPRGMMIMMPLMRALDTDGDGEISAREIKKAVTSLKILDRDGNGKLTPDELRPEMPGGPGGPGPNGPGGPDGPGPGGPGGGFGGPPSPDMFVNRAMEFDADGDGKLSKEELAKMAEGFMRGPRGGAGGAGGGGRPQRPEPNP
jgi:hypothetical protein